MYSIIVVYIVCLVATRAAVIPDTSNDSEAQVTNYENTNDGAGNYKFSFETSNGITRKEAGHLVNIGQEDEHMVVEGSYSYIDVDGKTVVVNYTADENGYHITRPRIELPYLSDVAPNVLATLLGK